jgi:hypothetical protein
MNILDRIKLPEPEFFKKVIRVSLGLSAGAAAILSADTFGSQIVPGFNFDVLPWVEIACKNIIVAGLAIASVSKTTTIKSEE